MSLEGLGSLLRSDLALTLFLLFSSVLSAGLQFGGGWFFVCPTPHPALHALASEQLCHPSLDRLKHSQPDRDMSYYCAKFSFPQG